MGKDTCYVMAQKFEDFYANYDAAVAEALRSIPFREKWYFFYGTLMDPKTLAHVLNRSDLPELLPATVYCYKTMLWGEYPAMLDEPKGGDVRGAVCKIKSEEEYKRLKACKTDMYYISGFAASLDGCSEVWGGRRSCGKVMSHSLGKVHSICTIGYGSRRHRTRW